MSIINLNNLNFNKEKTRLSPSRKFIYKNNLCTDRDLEYFEFEKSNIDKISFDDENYFGAIPIDAYQTKNIYELQGTTKIYITNLPVKSEYQARVYNDLLMPISSSFDQSKPVFTALTGLNDKTQFFQTRYFGIKRLQQEFKPLSKTNEKKKIIKNLYDYSKSQGDAGYNQSFNYGFSNYNCLNFFNILPSNSITNLTNKNKLLQTSHQCGLIYSNNILNQKNLYPGETGMSISFWINPKRMANIGYFYNPGCILHIPHVISVWLIENTNVKNENNQSIEFFIRVKISNNIANSSPRVINDTGTFTSEKSLKLNNWHNVNICFSTNQLLLYIDQDIAINVSQDFNFGLGNFESIFSIGNKINRSEYFSNSKEFLNNNNIRKYFFNQYSLTEQSLQEQEVVKYDSVSLDSPALTRSNNISKFFNTKIYASSTPNISQKLDESYALNAEIHNVAVFDEFLEFEKLYNFSKGNLDLLNGNTCIFYLPCAYIPETIYRKGYITIGEVDDLSYNSCVNPVFAHKIYGHELSVEHFVKDIINNRRPYIVGMDPVSYLNKFSNIGTNIPVIKTQMIIDYFVKHKTINQIINKHITSGNIFNDIEISIDPFLKNNLIYRNNFILPCDNGLCNIDISRFVTLNNENLKYLHNSELKHVNIESLFFDESKYLYDLPKNFFVKNIVFQTIKNFNPTLLNNRNIISGNYFNKVLLEKNIFTLSAQTTIYDYLILRNPQDPTPIQQKINNKINYIKNSLDSSYLASNSLFKIIDNETFETSNVLEKRSFSKIKSTTGADFQISPKNYYKKYNSHVSIEGEDTETHSIIFDISNALYSENIRKGHFSLKDIDIAGTGGALRINLKDNNGLLYRADCLTPHAKWNYVGHIFYRDGLATVMHPGLYSFGENNFCCELKGDHSLHTFEVNIPVEKGDLNYSLNKTYKRLRPSSGLYDTDEEGFVYITGVNLHDENLNIVARANFAQPIVKRQNDRYNVRLKMDY